MAEQAIVVLNAGSSSIKFSVFFRNGGTLELRLRGQIEAVFSAPRFLAKDAAGNPAGENSWPEGTKLGHNGALAHLLAFLRERARGAQLVGVGHRVVHGGMEYTEPVRVNARVLAALDKFVRDTVVRLRGTGVTMNLLDPGWLRTDLGGPNAPNSVESVMPGALMPALVDDDVQGKWFSAQDYANP